MTDDEHLIRKGQRTARDAARKTKKFVNSSKTKEALVTIAAEGAETVSRGYDKSGANKVAKPLKNVAKFSTKTIKNAVSKANEITGARKKASHAKATVNQYVVSPTNNFMDEKGVSETLGIAIQKAQNSYGDVRRFIKPYFAPEDAHEFLNVTKFELTKITACILHVSNKDAAGWMGQFGKLVSAKVAGVAGTVTLFGLVSTFGTAGTGTAIASLSGAAAGNATLAAIGLGGGMATGALVLSGFGIAVGMVTYRFLLSSTRRDFDTLPKEDKQIVETCSLLAAAIGEKMAEEPLELYADEALQFGIALEELHEYLKLHSERICARLDEKNSIKYRQHILKDFEPAVLDGLKIYTSKAPVSLDGTIGGVFYALLTRTALDGSLEQEMVMEALRRSNHELHEASESELSDYLSGQTPEQLQGLANNVKGIYHELMHVEQYNATHEDTYAELYNSTTHQGSDAVIKSTETHEVIEEYQLKATSSESYVREHQERYPEIEVIATDEVASNMEGVETSGYSNAELTENVDVVFENVGDNTLGDRVFESAEYAGLAAAGFEAIKILNGQTNLLDSGKQTVRTAANAAAATGITAFLFG